jgi:predicted ATPase
MSSPRPSPATPLIRTPDQRLRVFVSSTLQELAEERREAREAITRLRLAPVMFELGARPHPPRDLYRSYLEQSHIFVGIYWQRYGWVAPGMEISGLEDEYRLSGERPKLIYVKGLADEREERLERLLEAIRSDDMASYKPFTTAAELRELLENDLALLLTERFEASRLEVIRQAAGPDPLQTSLPVPPTPMVGRETELKAARALLLRTDVRLVTLLGPGGIGKSRIALELAATLQQDFSDGVVFVPLAAIGDPALFVPTVAHALGLRETGGKPLLESLKETLRDKELLLVLDNFEQLLEAAPLVAELLAAAPGLEVLVTSRAALRLSGEHEFPVPPLSLPEAREEADVERLSQSEAVRLFVERAQAVKPDFALTGENAAAVAEITRRLDGLPLALELAAARLRMLPPQALLARMARRLALLTGGARDLPLRQRTLKGTIDWSYSLLDEGEKLLLARLAVFSGGSALQAAESVCGGDIDVLERLLSLVDKSLVRLSDDGSGESRFSMLETVREYALEKLEASSEAKALRRRHADYFLAFAERAVPGLRGPEQRDWLFRLELEHDNLRTAMSYYLEAGEGVLALRLGTALHWFWVMRGHFGKGRRWLEAALERGTGVEPGLRAESLSAAGTLAWRQGDYSVARRYFEESLALRRGLGDGKAVASSLLSLGALAYAQGDYEDARALASEAMALQRELGDKLGVASALLSLGNVALDQGRPEARERYEESLALSRELGDKLMVAYALDNLGVLAWHDDDKDTKALTEEVLARYGDLGSRSGMAGATHRLGLLAFARGDYHEARERYEESLAIKRELGEARAIAFILYDLGRLALEEGDLEAARAHFREGLESVRTLGAKALILLYVEGLAAWWRKRGEATRAARLFAAAAAYRERAGIPVPRVNRARHERELEAVRSALDETSFDEAWQEGEATALEEAAGQALTAA